MKLKLYFFYSCPFCQIVLETIDQLSISVELIDIMADEEERDFLRKKTGRYTVPCLFIDDHPMHESRDIIEWLNLNKNKIQKND